MARFAVWALCAAVASNLLAAPALADPPGLQPSAAPARSATDPVSTTFQGASIARSADGKWLYVADEPTRSLYVAQTEKIGADELGATRVALPGRPGQIVVLPNEVLVTPDGGLVVVTSAWTHRVAGIDRARRETVWTVDVPREPRGIAIRAGSSGTSEAVVYISHLTSGALTRVDASRSGQAVVRSVELPVAPVGSTSPIRSASLGYGLVLSADTTRQAQRVGAEPIFRKNERRASGPSTPK